MYKLIVVLFLLDSDKASKMLDIKIIRAPLKRLQIIKIL